MSISHDNFLVAKARFLSKDELKEGAEIIKKITTIINELAVNFNSLNGGELSEMQVKLSGYKFYLSDHIADLMNKANYLEAWIKEEKASRYDETVESIQVMEPNLKNKEDLKKKVDNLLTISLSDDVNEQLFYDTEYNRYRMKMFSVDSILTSITMRLSELKRQQEQTR